MHSSTHFVAAGAKYSDSHKDKFIERFCERFSLNFDSSLSSREIRLTLLQMFLDGTIYDNLPPFYMEYQGGNGSYVKLSKRRPSVLYHLCKIIVNESVGMLFGEGHFPKVKCSEGHKKTEAFLEHINKVSKIRQTMLNAAYVGSIGSVCILIKVLKNKFYFDVLNTKHLKPVFDRMQPDKLVRLHDIKKTDGNTLISQGYSINENDKNKMFYVEREWNENEEIYYEPYLIEDKDKPKKIDSVNSSEHGLGFVPAVWIQNLPKSHHVDGDCTFEAALDISVEIDYHLSQLGRGLYYNSDPVLVVKDPSSINGSQFVKNTNVLKLDEKGDAYYAEINGNSVSSVLEYVKLLREFGMEAVRGNRASPDKLHAAQSGRALQMMNHPLVTLVDEMRLMYGEHALICIYRMCLDIYHSGQFDIDDGGNVPETTECIDHLCLFWQDWYPATGRDKLEEAQAISMYRQNGLISRETSINYISEEYGIESSEDEINLIDEESEESGKIEKSENLDKEKGNDKIKGDNESSSVDRERD